MKNISFALTCQQFIDRTKYVTRRDRWLTLESGAILCGVEKGQGLKRGEKVKRLGIIKVLSVRREPLQRLIDDPDYGKREARLEGFPEMTGEQFALMYLKHNGGTLSEDRTRIFYRYVDGVTT